MAKQDGNWMLTYTGRQFWMFEPRAKDVDLVDIGHALSNLCRFCGHCREFYSVAQHSVLVSQILPPWAPSLATRWGLLHDAAEAYLSDMIRPLKVSVRFRVASGEDRAQEVEARVEEAIATHFGLPWLEVKRIHRLVKEADSVALVTERRDLMTGYPISVGPPWIEQATIQPLDARITRCWGPREAEEAFFDRAEELGLVEGGGSLE